MTHKKVLRVKCDRNHGIEYEPDGYFRQPYIVRQASRTRDWTILILSWTLPCVIAWKLSIKSPKVYKQVKIIAPVSEEWAEQVDEGGYRRNLVNRERYQYVVGGKLFACIAVKKTSPDNLRERSILLPNTGYSSTFFDSIYKVSL